MGEKGKIKTSEKEKRAIEAIQDWNLKSCKIIITKDKNGRITESFVQKKEDL